MRSTVSNDVRQQNSQLPAKSIATRMPINGFGHAAVRIVANCSRNISLLRQSLHPQPPKQSTERVTYHHDRTSRLTCLSTFSSNITVVVCENLLSPLFSFVFKSGILQSIISPQLTKWFHHDSQNTSIPP